MSFNTGGAAAGAAAGSAAGPWGAAIGGLVGGFSGGGGGGAGNSAPSNASNMGQVEGPKLDSSGWNVIFGGGDIKTDRVETVAGQFSQYLPYVLAVGGILIAWRYLKKSK